MAKVKVKEAENPSEPAPKRRPGPRSVPELATRSKALATNLRPHLAEMPHLAALHGELERVVARIEASIAEQDTLAARIRGLITARAEEMLQGRDVRNRLAAQLQGQFGLTSDELRGFGLKPRKRKLRRKPQEEVPPPEPEEPAA
jgi:hypothetical protein